MTTLTSRSMADTVTLEADPLEPDEEWKNNLRKQIEEGLKSMIVDAMRNERQSGEAPVKLDKWDLNDTNSLIMRKYHRLAQEQFQNGVERERAERRMSAGLPVDQVWAESLKKEQQAILDNIKKDDSQRSQSTSSNIDTRPIYQHPDRPPLPHLNPDPPDSNHSTPISPSPMSPRDHRSPHSGNLGRTSRDSLRTAAGSDVHPPSFTERPQERWRPSEPPVEESERHRRTSQTLDSSRKPSMASMSGARGESFGRSGSAASRNSVQNDRRIPERWLQGEQPIVDEPEDSIRPSRDHTDSSVRKPAASSPPRGFSKADFWMPSISPEEDAAYSRTLAQARRMNSSSTMSSTYRSPTSSQFQDRGSPVVDTHPNVQREKTTMEETQKQWSSHDKAREREQGYIRSESWQSVSNEAQYSRPQESSTSNPVYPTSRSPDMARYPAPPPPLLNRPLAREKSIIVDDDYSRQLTGSPLTPDSPQKFSSPPTSIPIPRQRSSYHDENTHVKQHSLNSPRGWDGASRSPEGSRYDAGLSRSPPSSEDPPRAWAQRSQPSYQEPQYSSQRTDFIEKSERNEDSADASETSDTDLEDLTSKAEETRLVAERMAEQARRMQEEVKRREEAKRLKQEAKQREEEARVRKEEEVKQKEEEANRRALEVQRQEEESRRKAEEIKKREEDLRRREELLELREAEAKRKEEQERQRIHLELKKQDEERRNKAAELKRQEDERWHEEEAQKTELRRRREVEEQWAARNAMHEQQDEVRGRDSDTPRRADEHHRQDSLGPHTSNARTGSTASASASIETRRREGPEAQWTESNTMRGQQESRRHEPDTYNRADERQRQDSLGSHPSITRSVPSASPSNGPRWREEDEASWTKIDAARDQREDMRRREADTRSRAEERQRQDSLESSYSTNARPGTIHPPANSNLRPGSSRSGSASNESAGTHRISTNSSSQSSTSPGWASWGRASGASQMSGASWTPPSASTPTGNVKPGTPTTPTAAHTPRSSGISHGPPPSTNPSVRLDEAEWNQRQARLAQEQQEKFRLEQERLAAEKESKSGALSKTDVLRLFAAHEQTWSGLESIQEFSWFSVPWPVLKRPSAPEDITTAALSAYVLSPYGDNMKTSKERITQHIRRWHPDRFDTKLLPKVKEGERAKVKQGAGEVARGLNQLLTRSQVNDVFS